MKFVRIDVVFFFTIILLSAFAIYYADFSSFITFFTLFGLGRLLLRKQVFTVKKLQGISFLINICSAIAITFCFEFLYGTWHSFGIDDLTFFTISSELAKGNELFKINEEYLQWGSVQYKLYVLVFSYWFKTLSVFGIKSNFFFHLNIINAFIGSFIAPFVYKIGLKLFKGTSITPKKAAMLCVFFPILIYYSSVIIRDSWIISIFLMVVYLVISSKSMIKKFFLITVLLLCVFYLRKSSAVFISFFVLLYVAFNTNNRHIIFFINRVVPVVILGILLVFFIAIQLPVPEVAPSNTDVLNYISYTVNFYRELSAREAVQSSFGLRLRLSNNPIVLFVYYIYFYLSPVPPLFFKEFNLVTLFIGIGNIIWYLLSPLYFIHTFQLRNYNKKIFVRAFFWFLILVLIMVGTATGEQRHLLLIYPVVLLFAVDYILNHRNQFYRYIQFFLILALISAILYLIVKMML